MTSQPSFPGLLRARARRLIGPTGVVTALALLVGGLLTAAPAQAVQIDMGTLTPGAQVTAAPTTTTDELIYHVTVPANTRLTLTADTSATPMVASLAIYDQAGQLIDASQFGNSYSWQQYYEFSQPPRPYDQSLTLGLTAIWATGTVPFTAQLATDLPSRAITFGTPSTITLTQPGQQATLTFAGIAGHKLGVLVTDNVFVQGTYRLDAEGADRPGFPEPIQSALIDMRDTLYTIHFDPYGPAIGSITLTLVDVVDITSPLVLGTDVTARFDTPWTRLAMPFTEVPNAHLRVDVVSSTLAHSDGTPSSASVTAGDLTWWTADQLGSFGNGATTLYDDRIMTTAVPSGLGITTDGLSTGTVVFRVTAVPETPAVPAPLGTPTTVHLDVPWQSRSFSFRATTGQRFVMSTADNNLTAGNGYPFYTLQLIAPDGTVTQVDSEFTVPGPAGTWVLRVDPSLDTTGTFTLTLAPKPSVTVPVALGRTLTATATAPNSIIYLPAGRAPGTPLPMVVIRSMSMVDSSGAQPQVRLQFEQNGVLLGSEVAVNPTTVTNYSFQAPPELDTSKPWRLTVLPGPTTTGSISLSFLTPRTTTAAVASGGSATVTLRGVGDAADLTTAVPAGRKLVVDLSSAPPGVAVSFVTADGSPLGGVNASSFAESSPLPTTGRATIRLTLTGDGHYGATFSVKVLVVADPVVKLDGPTKISWTLGQAPKLTFKGQPGRRLTVMFTKTAWAPPSTPVYAYLTDPSGNDMFVQYGCQSGSTCFYEGPAMAAGTYTVSFAPELGSAGSFVAVIGQITDISRTITVDTPATVTFAQPGQVANLTMSLPATSGLSWAATSGPSGTMTLLDSNQMMRGIEYLPAGASNGTFQLWQSLPAGTYTMRIDPKDAQIGTVKVTFTATP